MNTTASKVRIVYYDTEGKHETTPCSSINLLCVNYSVPNIKEPTLTFSMWYGDDDIGHSEKITVPFSHTIEPV